jgi:membrane-bound lytic murein transglycosylase B
MDRRVLRGLGRTGAALLAGCVALASSAPSAQTREPSAIDVQALLPQFQRFVEALWPEARARGVSAETFHTAFAGVTPDPKIISLSQNQSEFVRPIWDYIAGAVTPARVTKGQAVADELAGVLDTVESVYGLPKGVVLGIWGMETNFGRFTGSIYVVRALATLAFIRYRAEFFRGELLTALDILEQNHVQASNMLGSWAGAMGQTQFMPSNFVRYAIDGDGDGKRNIWTSRPDALASTANYLRKKGWQPGLPWGFEVELPDGFDFRHHRLSFGDWRRAGVRRIDRKDMPRLGEAALLLPAGASGPAFLVTDNYDIIKTYNPSDAYALAVGHLGDRIYGGQPIEGRWPKDEPLLDKAGREEVQTRLTVLGLYSGNADGRLGSKTRAAVREFQLRRGLKADGYANSALLKELRAVR